MSDEKKRGRSASMEAGKNKPAPAKRQRVLRGEPEPEPALPPPEIRPPDTAGFFKRITTIAKASSARASGHQGYRLTVGIEEGAQKLKQPWSADGADNRVKPGHLSSADYEDGYISDDGDRFLKSIHAHKDREIEGVAGLKQAAKKSRSGNPIRIGTIATAPYHGVDIKFRVDFTEIVEKPASSGEEEEEEEPVRKRWEPHVRVYAFGKDVKTKELAGFAEQIGEHADPVPQQHFLAGVKGQAPPGEQISSEYATGVEYRAVGRASDAFGTVFPALDGLVLSHPQSPKDVRNLYFNPEFGTGALGHQNSGVGATGDFNAFKEIVADTRVEHTANRGTALDKVALIRKARAINAAVPADRPIVSIDTRAKGK